MLGVTLTNDEEIEPVGGLVFSYRNHNSVINATEGLGLLIADEGHRLKNSAETKTARALKACPAAMRLVMVRHRLVWAHTELQR